MSTTRRVFLKSAAGTITLCLTPLACERNSITPKFTGGRFDFLTPVDTGLDRFDRLDGTHFVQFGATTSVPGWRYEDVPVFAPNDWQLALTGSLERPTTLNFEDLQARAGTDGRQVVNTLRCIIDTTGVPGLVGTATWRGVPLSTFLDEAGVLSTVRRFRIFGKDGFTNNLTRAALEPTVNGREPPLLVYEMNGAPIPHIHGGPVRLLVPSRYGYKSVKWVERIEATEDDGVFGSYQQALGFFDDATIAVTTKVTDPLTEATVPAGTYEVFGYALSGAAPVERVEVSVDGGAFEAATIDPLERVLFDFPELADTIQVQQGRPYPFTGVWSIFRYQWNAIPGRRQLRVRTTDAAGNQSVPVDGDLTDGIESDWTISVTVS